MPEAEVRDAEVGVVGGIFVDPSVRDRVAATGLRPVDFDSPRLGAIYAAQLRANGRLDLQTISDDLEHRGELDAVGGLGALSAVCDATATAALAEPAARLVIRASLTRTLLTSLRLAAEGAPYDPQQLRALEDALARDGLPEVPAHPVGFVGETLEALRDREDPVSPLPGLLDPEPGLHILVGRSARGKTTLALYLALCWACGVSPWRHAPPLPGGRVLVVSREQNVTRLDRRARQLEPCTPTLSRDLWTGLVSIVARDAHLPALLRPLLRLDAGGLSLLDTVLAQAEAAGEPYRLLVLDSLSRLKPTDVEENDNDAMTVWLDGLQDLAERHGCWLLLIHHEGKGQGGGDGRGAARGASAIDAVAQGTWVLEQGDTETTRRLRVHGNALDERSYTFAVSPDEDPGKVLFWRLEEDDASSFPVADYLAPGQRVSLRELARALFDDDAYRPRNRAKRVAYAWERAGLVAIEEPDTRGKALTIARTAGTMEGPEECPEDGGEYTHDDDIPF